MGTDENLSQARTVKLNDEPAPALTLPAVRAGEPQVSLNGNGGQPVVVNFFGSWSAPSLRELPDMQAVAERHAGKVAFIGVAVNDTRRGARRMLERTGVTYPVGLDEDSDAVLDYAVDGIPTTVFISPEGRLLERAEGPLSELQLEAVIDRLFFDTA
jgi:thiol-disulfide isomerase/thioredoxin